MHGVIAVIALIVLVLITIGMNKAHKDATGGVPMPPRGSMKAIRRAARKKGISEQQAYDEWLARKQRKIANGKHPF